MKKLFFTFLITCCFCTVQLLAQTVTDSLPTTQTIAKQMRHFKIGIFAPLYLDSVFSSSGEFKPKQGMPKFIIPAVDFVNGAQVALDSMKLQNENIDAYIYDTKSYAQSLASLLAGSSVNDFDLLIGAVKDMDYRLLADFAAAKQIPFISAVYPNDGGVTKNSYTVILNSTLKAHCEAIYAYLLQSHGTDKIILCRKKGQQEDKVASYFKMFSEKEGESLLKIQTIGIDSNLNSDFLMRKLDSNSNTVIIGASLDEKFARDLALSCNDLYKKYHITLIGMPNWDGFKSLQKKDDFENFPIYYTTPFYNNKTDYFSRLIIEAFSKNTKGKPTDMAYKGFECTYYFTKLLTKHPENLMDNINDKTFKLFSDYNFKPVILNRESSSPDYFENKHLFFVKLINGNLYKAW